MEILGLEELFKDKKDEKIKFGEFAEKMSKKLGVDIDIFTKSAILSCLSTGNIELYKQLKKVYLDATERAYNKKLEMFGDKEEFDRIQKMEELELEIQQTKLMCVNKKLEELK